MSRLPDRRGTRFSLISGSTYLGPLEPEKLAALFPARVPITDSQVDLGTRAWRAFCSPEPDALEQITDEDTSALPFLAGALRRHFEDYPSVASGLSRSEAQILDAIESGAATLRDAFLACSRMEERIFMGDWTFLSIARGLASAAAHPLIAVDLTGAGPSLPSGPVSLTALGRDVREGLADHVLLNGIDRWAGGVHLTMRRCYRWNGQSLVLTRS
jgi:hypothetical protein